MSLIHQINTQEQRRIFFKILMQSLGASPLHQTPKSGAMNFTVLEEALFLIIKKYIHIQQLNIEEQKVDF